MHSSSSDSCPAAEGHRSSSVGSVNKVPVSPHKNRFKTRHLSMMALGSAIGAGFFLGTGVAISQAGPSIIISYVLAAVFAIFVIFSLAELAAALPSTGSFSTYAEAGIGRWAGFTVGWVYWAMLIMVLGMEITGAAQIFTGWFPMVPQWTTALVIVLVFGGINLLAAGHFGEVEAVLAGVKVLAIIGFLVIAVCLVTGVISGRTENIWVTMNGHGGFFPKGFAGVASGILAIITSFGGIEIVTIAAAEAEDAKLAISKAIRTVILRIVVFYVGSVVLILFLLPWDSPVMKTSPFAAVLDMARIPYVGRIMEAVVFIALISAFSANVYASSRMAYSLSARNMGVKWLLGGANIDDTQPAALAQISVGSEEFSTGQNAHISPSTHLHKINSDSSVSSSVHSSLPDYDASATGVDASVLEEATEGDIARGKTPRRAVLLSVVLALVSVALNWLLPKTLLGILINAIGMAILVVWLFVIISQMRLRAVLEKKDTLTVRMPGHPWSGWCVLIAMGIIAVFMAWEPASRVQLISMSVMTVVIILIYFIRRQFSLRSLGK